VCVSISFMVYPSVSMEGMLSGWMAFVSILSSGSFQGSSSVVRPFKSTRSTTMMAPSVLFMEPPASPSPPHEREDSNRSSLPLSLEKDGNEWNLSSPCCLESIHGDESSPSRNNQSTEVLEFNDFEDYAGSGTRADNVMEDAFRQKVEEILADPDSDLNYEAWVKSTMKKIEEMTREDKLRHIWSGYTSQIAVNKDHSECTAAEDWNYPGNFTEKNGKNEKKNDIINVYSRKTIEVETKYFILVNKHPAIKDVEALKKAREVWGMAHFHLGEYHDNMSAEDERIHNAMDLLSKYDLAIDEAILRANQSKVVEYAQLVSSNSIRYYNVIITCAAFKDELAHEYDEWCQLDMALGKSIRKLESEDEQLRLAIEKAESLSKALDIMEYRIQEQYSIVKFLDYCESMQNMLKYAKEKLWNDEMAQVLSPLEKKYNSAHDDLLAKTKDIFSLDDDDPEMQKTFEAAKAIITILKKFNLC